MAWNDAGRAWRGTALRRRMRRRDIHGSLAAIEGGGQETRPRPRRLSRGGGHLPLSADGMRDAGWPEAIRAARCMLRRAAVGAPEIRFS
ncbi:hypothetical protein [Xanthomonas tesorieronis]|uniref:hypothetical protein n=1 Tax=Xanthomonas tesorieronis TaxID=3160839 RepID=UPI003514561B